MQYDETVETVSSVIPNDNSPLTAEIEPNFKQISTPIAIIFQLTTVVSFHNFNQQLTLAYLDGNLFLNWLS
jgi:hypothetical protein